MAADGEAEQIMELDTTSLHLQATETFEATECPHPFAGMPMLGRRSTTQPKYLERPTKIVTGSLVVCYVPNPEYNHPFYVAKVLKIFRDLKLGKL